MGSAKGEKRQLVLFDLNNCGYYYCNIPQRLLGQYIERHCRATNYGRRDANTLARTTILAAGRSRYPAPKFSMTSAENFFHRSPSTAGDSFQSCSELYDCMSIGKEIHSLVRNQPSPIIIKYFNDIIPNSITGSVHHYLKFTLHTIYSGLCSSLRLQTNRWHHRPLFDIRLFLSPVG